MRRRPAGHWAPEKEKELFRGGFDPACFADPAWFLLTNDPNLKAEDRRTAPLKNGLFSVISAGISLHSRFNVIF